MELNHEFNGYKDVTFTIMPSGNKIVYSTVEGRRFNEGYKDRKRKRYSKIAPFVECKDKIPKKRIGLKDINDKDIKEKKEYYKNQLQGSLEYLHLQLDDFRAKFISFMFISDLTILYSVLIEELRKVLIDIYVKHGLKNIEHWNFKILYGRNPFYLHFDSISVLEYFCDIFKESGTEKELYERYYELGKLLLRVERNLNSYNIKFSRHVVQNYIIKKIGY